MIRTFVSVLACAALMPLHAFAIDLTWSYFDRTAFCCGPMASGFGSYGAAVAAAREAVGTGSDAGQRWKNIEVYVDPLMLYPYTLPRERYWNGQTIFADTPASVCMQDFAASGGSYTGPPIPDAFPMMIDRWRCWGHNESGDDAYRTAMPTCVSTGYAFSNFGAYKGNGQPVPPDMCYSNHSTQIISTVDPKKSDACCNDVEVGNPVNVALGIKRHRELVYVSAPLVKPLRFEWLYSTNMYATPVKTAGWSHTYNRRLVFTWITEVFAYRESGVIARFAWDGATGAYRPDADIADRLTRSVDVNGNTTGWTYYIAGTEETETYDAAGLLLSIQDRSGAALTLTYSDATTSPLIAPYGGLLIRVTDPMGRQINLAWSNAGGTTKLYDANNTPYTYHRGSRLDALTDPAGNDYHFAYDASGNLTAVGYPDGNTRRYVYEDARYPNALTGIVDEEGQRFATYRYDIAGRVDSETHAGGANGYSLVYNTNGTSTVTDPLGTIRTYDFSIVLGAVKKAGMTQPCTGCGDGSKAIAYDRNGNVASRTDFNDRKLCHAYDLNRNLEIVRLEGALASEACATVLTSPPGRTDVRRIVTTWHPTFRLPATVSEPAPGGTRTTTYTYNSTGDLTGKSIAGPGNDGSGAITTRTWNWTYGTLGRVATAIDPLGRITTYAYYSDFDADPGRRGNLRTVTNAAGHVTEIAGYDVHGRPLSISDPNGLVTTLVYDARGRLTSRRVGGETTSYAYDGIGQLTRVTLPDASYVQYAYDAAHRLTRISDGLGNRIVYTLDAIGNRVKEDVSDHLNILARTRSRVFDSLNRLVSDVGALGQTTSYGYDAHGNRLTATDPLAHATANTYDALNRLSTVTDPGAGVTRYVYDAAGNLAQVTDARSLATVYTYDGLGNPIRQDSPDTGTSSQTFDAAGNLITKVDARAVTATHTYDALNRVTRIAYTKSGSTTDTHSFEYDGGVGGAANAKGRLTKVSDPAATTQWSYDGQGRILSKSQQAGGVTRTVAYGYNAAGQMQTLTTPSGQVLGYTYLNNRISGITVNGSTLISSALTAPFGPTAAWNWGNTLKTFRDHDTDGRLKSWEFRNGASVLRNDLTFDTANRIVTIGDAANAALAGIYLYDNLDRLIVAQKGAPVAATQQFTYDAVGNRLGVTVDGSPTNLTFGIGSNRLATLAGALLPDPLHGDGSRTYTYNLANRLVQVQSAGGTMATYQVNALGQRIAKMVGSAMTRFVYDERGHLLGEYDADGKLIQETVWMDDLPVATLRPVPGSTSTPVEVDTLYVHADHLGSPRAVTRPADNAMLWRWDNVDPFGANAADENPTGQGWFAYGLRFPGQYYDAETGAHYNYYRDYDPSVGRYEQSDPIGLRGGLNSYTYAYLNPVGLTDSMGLEVNLCTRRLNNVPFRFGPLYHQYICVGNATNGYSCGGLGPTGNMFDSPGRIEPDSYGPSSCEKKQDDNKCLEDCIRDQLRTNVPNYSVDLSRGENCQTYTVEILSVCKAKCKVK